MQFYKNIQNLFGNYVVDAKQTKKVFTILI